MYKKILKIDINPYLSPLKTLQIFGLIFKNLSHNVIDKNQYYN